MKIVLDVQCEKMSECRCEDCWFENADGNCDGHAESECRVGAASLNENKA